MIKTAVRRINFQQEFVRSIGEEYPQGVMLVAVPSVSCEFALKHGVVVDMEVRLTQAERAEMEALLKKIAERAEGEFKANV